MNLTAANQLTILRMLLIPAFVILLLYGYQGWALVTFFVAGLTDLLDGLIARRAGQKTTLGAWLDPMADKLLLVTMFIVLTLPGHRLGEPPADLVHDLVISRDVAIVATVAVVNLAVGPRTFRPSIFGKIATATYIVTGVVTLYFNYLGQTTPIVDRVRLRVARDHVDLSVSLPDSGGQDRAVAGPVRSHSWPSVSAATCSRK